MSSARGHAEKTEKKTRHKRVSLRMAMWELKFRIHHERPERRPQLEAKLSKLAAAYTALGGL